MKFEDNVEFFGQSFSQQGQCTFYKGFKFKAGGKPQVVLLGEFVLVKIWPEEETVVVGEMQLCWHDRIQEGNFCSVKLYFLPEHTIEGRTLNHGRDEVMSVSEDVIIRIDDLISLIPEGYKWEHGQKGVCLGPDHVANSDSLGPVKDYNPPYSCKMRGSLCMKNVRREKRTLGNNWVTSKVIVVNYASYCRYRSALRRFEGNNSAFAHALVMALGGFAVPDPNTRVLFCKDNFDYPELEGHELVCNHLAPKFPTKKPKKTPQKAVQSPIKATVPKQEEEYIPRRQSLIKPCHRPVAVGLPAKPKEPVSPPELTPRSLKLNAAAMAEQSFLEKLYKFMKSRGTPIDRLPSVGNEKLNLYKFHSIVSKVGGYEAVSLKRYWRRLYLEMGGYCSNNAAATATRKHYERFLLPFEQHLSSQTRSASKGTSPCRPPLSKPADSALPQAGPELRPRAQPSTLTHPSWSPRKGRRKNKTPVKMEKENVQENEVKPNQDEIKCERTADEIDSRLCAKKPAVETSVRIAKEANKITSYAEATTVPGQEMDWKLEPGLNPGPSASTSHQFSIRPAHISRPTSQVHVPRPGSHQSLPAEILPSLRTLSELNISIVAADGTKISTGVDGRSALENLAKRPLPEVYDQSPKKSRLEHSASVFDPKSGLLTGSANKSALGLQVLKNLGSGFSIIPVSGKKPDKRPVPPLISIDKKQKEATELISNVNMLMNRPDLKVEVKGSSHDQPSSSAFKPRAEMRPVQFQPELGLDLTKKKGVSIYPVTTTEQSRPVTTKEQSRPVTTKEQFRPVTAKEQSRPSVKQPDSRATSFQPFLNPYAPMIFQPTLQPNFLQMMGMANVPMVGNPAMVQLYKDMLQNGGLRPPMNDLERLIAMQQSMQKPTNK